MNLSEDLSVDKELFSGVYEGKYKAIDFTENINLYELKQLGYSDTECCETHYYGNDIYSIVLESEHVYQYFLTRIISFHKIAKNLQ